MNLSSPNQQACKLLANNLQVTLHTNSSISTIFNDHLCKIAHEGWDQLSYFA
jgi:hypothetical protein